MNYANVYPELVNKLRWAIATSFADEGSNFPFSDAQKIATVFSQDIVGLVQLARAEPAILGSIATIRTTLQQHQIDTALDVLTKP